MIVEPVTLRPEHTVAEALELMERYRISGVPITDDEGVLVGILTNRDLRFETDTSQPVSALMTARNLVTAPVGTTLEEAEAILHRNKIEKLPVVDADGRLKGLITVKDISKRIKYPDATKDDAGPAARRRGGRRRAGCDGARGRARRRRGGRARRRHRARPLARRPRRRPQDSRREHDVELDRREHLDGRRRARARRRGSGRGEGRPGPGVLRRRHTCSHGGLDVQEHRERPRRRSRHQHVRRAGRRASRVVHRCTRGRRRPSRRRAG